jgi:hypothetical protein
LELLSEEERDRLVRELLGDAEIKLAIAAIGVAPDRREVVVSGILQHPE